MPTDVRTSIAEISEHIPQAEGLSNGEEGTYPRYPYQANYSKALKKDLASGRSDPDPTAYGTYLKILELGRTRQDNLFYKIELGGCDEAPCGCLGRFRPRPLTNPQGGLAFNFVGQDSSAVNLNLFRNDPRSIRPAPRIDGAPVQDQWGNTVTLKHENTAEMVELYWMALVRDLPFRRWTDPVADRRRLQSPPPGWSSLEPTSGPPLIDQAVADLNNYRSYFAEEYPVGGGPVNNENVFRGAAYGDQFGPFISQFLLRGNTVLCRRGREIRNLPEDGVIPEGNVPNLQTQTTVEPYIDYLRDQCSWRCVEQGADDPSGTDANECGGNRFIRNLRDLATWVHIDNPAQHFRNAALLLLDEPPLQTDVPRPLPDPCGTRPARPFAISPCSHYRAPHRDHANQMGFVTFGSEMAVNLVNEVTELALMAAWWEKWYVHRRLRPEEFGGLVHYQKLAMDAGERGPYPCIDPLVFSSPVLELIKRRNTFLDPISGVGFEPENGAPEKTYFLPEVFPEGCPTHPSYPSGHATISGACATLLKAIFDETSRMTDPRNTIPTDPRRLPVAFESDENGRALAVASNQDVLTVGGELDKLASNVSIGRNAAGVHWRSDATMGMELGEAITTYFLFEKAFMFNEDEFCFCFRRFFRDERVQISRTTDRSGGSETRIVSVFIRPADEAKCNEMNDVRPVHQAKIDVPFGP